VVPNQAYGFILGAAIAKGRISRMDLDNAKAAPGVITIVSTLDMPKLPLSKMNIACLFGGAEIAHYHQAIALVVAETFEQARAAASLIRVGYTRAQGKFDLTAEANAAPPAGPIDRVGNFDAAFQAAQVKLDEQYSTPDQSHMMMEPHASLAAWDGDRLTVWTSNQMITWGKRDLANTLSFPEQNFLLISPYIGRGI